jgi:hypothetical protein
MIIQPHRELVTRGLQGWWLHGAENGTDASGLGRNGVVSGSPVWGDFMNQRTINFDGVDDVISDCGTVADFAFMHNTGVLSFAFMANPSSNTARMFFGSTGASAESGFFLGVENTPGVGVNAMRFSLFGGLGVSGSGIANGVTDNNTVLVGSADSWCYVLDVSINRLGQWYKNGIAMMTTSSVPATQPLVPGNATRTLRIGAFNSTSITNPMRGFWSDIRIYNVALTQNEIAAIAAGRG